MRSHRLVNPSSLPVPAGYSYAVVAAPGQLVFLAGQTGAEAGPALVDQFDRACANVLTALTAAGAQPEHLVWLQIFVTDVATYRVSLEPIGAAWRRHFGRHYPAMGLFEVRSLFDPAAKVELMGLAVIPDSHER